MHALSCFVFGSGWLVAQVVVPGAKPKAMIRTGLCLNHLCILMPPPLQEDLRGQKPMAVQEKCSC